MNAFLNNGNRPASNEPTASFLSSKTSSGVEYSRKQISLTSEEFIASASYQLVDATGINMDDDETTSGSIASDGYDSYNVPEVIFHHQHIRRHWFHKIYQKLKTPLKYGTLTKENICIPCFRSLDGKPGDNHAWKKFVKSSAL